MGSVSRVRSTRSLSFRSNPPITKQGRARVATFSLAATLSMTLAGHARAVDRIWTPGGVGDFSDATKYTNGAPVNGDSVFSDGTGSILNYQPTDTYTLTTLRLNNDSGATVFNQLGGSLTLTNLNLGNTGAGASRSPKYNMSAGTLNVTTLNWGAGNATQFNQSGGIVTVGSAFQVGRLNSANGSITLTNNAVFNATTNSTIFLANVASAGDAAQGSLSLSGTSQFNAAAATLVVGQFGSGKGTVTVGGTSSLSTALIVVGNNNAPSNINGEVNINGGTVTTGSIRKGNSALTANPTTLAVNIDNGTINATTHADNALFFNNLYVNLASGGLKFNSNGNDATITAGMNGVGGVEKLGTGTLSLTGANTYTGTTTVTAGTLRLGVDNALADASVLVLNGGTLVADGGTDLIGSLGLSVASVLQFGAADATAHTLTFADATGSGALNVTNWSDGVDQFLFTSLADAEAVAAVTTFIDPNGFAGFFGGTAVASGDNFAVVPVPEPASLALLALGGFAMVGRRRHA